jgi:hypothetical protein
MKGVRCEVSDGVADRREIINTLEKGGHIDRKYSRHELRNGEKDGNNVYSKACVVEECVELSHIRMNF